MQENAWVANTMYFRFYRQYRKTQILLGLGMRWQFQNVSQPLFERITLTPHPLFFSKWENMIAQDCLPFADRSHAKYVAWKNI